MEAGIAEKSGNADGVKATTANDRGRGQTSTTRGGRERWEET
jgi:hypothetical protein